MRNKRQWMRNTEKEGKQNTEKTGKKMLEKIQLFLRFFLIAHDSLFDERHNSLEI